MPRGKRKSASSPVEDSQSDDESVGGNPHGMTFSQLAPEISQDIFPVKPNEKKNLDSLDPQDREKKLMDLSRLVLFKALAGEPIDRLKCCKDAGISNDHGKISSAAFAEVAERLQNVFGFELKRIPKWMEDYKSLPTKFKDRYYVVTATLDDQQGSHSKAMYSVHADSAVEKGLLMVVLALAFCKGDPRPDGSRWILDAELYRLLNSLDENIPNEPPQQGTGTKKSSTPRRHTDSSEEESGVGMTPDVDHLLAKFVSMDYLFKEKISDEKLQSTPNADENSFLYALGPRAAIEIGRRQLVYFCAEILDVEPDATMLDEFEDEHQDEMEEEIEG